MKKLFTYLFIGALTMSYSMISAQDKAAPSPFSKVEQKVGTTDVTIEYSRPGAKDRKVMGELVPFGKTWRTGANSTTKITFSKDVTVEGKELAAGKYVILTVPGQDSWDVEFHTSAEGGWPSFDSKEPKLKVSVTPQSLGDVMVETFFITLGELRDNSGTLMFIWENTMVPVELGVK